jgi:hypothetical protein
MKNIHKIVKNARNGNRSWRQELNSFLRNYRTTPHSSTGVAPNDLIFRHPNSSKLPKWSETSNNEYKRLILKALNRNKKANQSMKRTQIKTDTH